MDAPPQLDGTVSVTVPCRCGGLEAPMVVPPLMLMPTASSQPAAALVARIGCDDGTLSTYVPAPTPTGNELPSRR